MNPLRSTLLRSTRVNPRALVASGSILGATSRIGGIRAAGVRGYSTESPKKGGSGGVVFLSKCSFFVMQMIQFDLIMHETH